jgi:hypothetical protein
VFCCYRCANFAGGVLPNRAALAADWVANFAMSSRRRNFCFLNLLNLALSPFCDDICPGSSNLFVAQRAEDKSVHSSIRQVTDERCEGQDTLRRNPLLRLRVRLLGLLPGCQQNVLRHARSILYFSKDLPCRCGLGNLAQRNDRREVRETVFPETCSRPPASEAIYRKSVPAQTVDATLAWSLAAGVWKPKVFLGR